MMKSKFNESQKYGRWSFSFFVNRNELGRLQNDLSKSNL
jgi:hypothetical protein